MVTIALDAMGGDIGIDVTVPAALETLGNCSDVHLSLVGDAVQLKAKLQQLGASDDSRLSICHTTQTVDMDEPQLRPCA